MDLTRVITVLENPWTLRAGIGVFTLVAVVFVFTIHFPTVDWIGHVPYAGTIAPDEGRHIANILYYAHRPLADGPIIHDAPPQLLTMGEIERFASYFYYYALSFPVKVLVNLDVAYSHIVYLLRLTSVVFGVIGLVAAHRLLRTMGFSASISTLTVLLVAFTGRYAWQSAAVSYDAPSTTLYIIALLYCARMIRDSSRVWSDLVGVALAGLGAIVVKYTFVPFVLVAGAVAVVLVVQRDGWRPFAHPVRRLGAAFRSRPLRSSGTAVLLVGVIAVFTERIGGNLLVYGQFNPSCTKLHTRVQCLAFDIYRRNYNAERLHDLTVRARGDLSPFDLLSFVGDWTSDYFQSMFFYRGRGTTDWHVETIVLLAGTFVFIAALIAIIISAKSLLRTRGFVFGAVIAGSYVAAMFVFNVQTFVKLDNNYAFSGRYLLPVLPLIYAFAVVAALALWRSFTPGWRTALAVPVALLGVFVLVTYSAPVAFFVYANDPSWYTPFSLKWLPAFITGRAG